MANTNTEKELKLYEVTFNEKVAGSTFSYRNGDKGEMQLEACVQAVFEGVATTSSAEVNAAVKALKQKD